MTDHDANVPGNPWEGWDEMAEPPDEEFEDYVPADVREQMAAVEQTREGQGDEESDIEFALRDRYGIVDWAALFGTDFSKVEWLPGRFLERGQQATLVGDGKAGKSLLALEWAWRCVAGRPFLGDKGHKPLTVLYVDKENSPRDLFTRLQALGARQDELVNLKYAQFPKLAGTLDGEESKAAMEFLNLVDHYKADIVIIDTVSRFIGGKENDSDTWLSLYRNIHEKMKARGVACLRLDHFGKDDTKGSRGSSAKSQDVDHVWELGRSNEKVETEDGIETVTTGLKLHRTHTRTGLGRGEFPLTRIGQKLTDGGWVPGSTVHELADPKAVAEREQDESAVVVRKAEEIKRAGFRGNPSRRAIADFCRTKGIAGVKATLMGKVAEQLKFELGAAAE